MERTLDDFEKRYNALSDITKERTAHALRDKPILSEEACWRILELAEWFDKLVKVGLAK